MAIAIVMTFKIVGKSCLIWDVCCLHTLDVWEVFTKMYLQPQVYMDKAACNRPYWWSLDAVCHAPDYAWVIQNQILSWDDQYPCNKNRNT